MDKYLRLSFAPKNESNSYSFKINFNVNAYQMTSQVVFKMALDESTILAVAIPLPLPDNIALTCVENPAKHN